VLATVQSWRLGDFRSRSTAWIRREWERSGRAALAYPAPDVEGWHNFLRSQGRSEEDLNATFAIEDPAGVRPRMFFQRVHDPKSVKNRVHVDLAAPISGSSDRAEEIDAFAERLTALGAHRLRAVKKDDSYFLVLAEPEGNEFCVD
jgi:hypothetical protein